MTQSPVNIEAQSTVFRSQYTNLIFQGYDRTPNHVSFKLTNKGHAGPYSDEDNNNLLGRPTYLSADFRFYTAILSFHLLSLSFFFRPLHAELDERNSTKTGHMLASKCDLKMHVRNLGYTLSLQIGCRKTAYFRRLCNLTANLTAYISRE